MISNVVQIIPAKQQMKMLFGTRISTWHNSDKKSSFLQGIVLFMHSFLNLVLPSFLLGAFLNNNFLRPLGIAPIVSLYVEPNSSRMTSKTWVDLTPSWQKQNTEFLRQIIEKNLPLNDSTIPDKPLKNWFGHEYHWKSFYVLPIPMPLP